MKQRAAGQRSIATVVRELIDEPTQKTDFAADPFNLHIVAKQDGSGEAYHAQDVKCDLYKRRS